jgi:hypothetical protein
MPEQSEVRIGNKFERRSTTALLTMPDRPLLSKNSTMPIDPLVISDAIVPKLTAGDKHAKYRNRIAGMTCRFFANASVQSEM